MLCAKERFDRQIRGMTEESFEERGVNRFRALPPQGLVRGTTSHKMTEEVGTLRE